MSTTRRNMGTPVATPHMSLACFHDDHDDETLTYRVSYVLPGGLFGIEPGYVVLGLHSMTTRTSQEPT